MNELLSLNPVVNSNDCSTWTEKKRSLSLKRASPISLDNIITQAIHCSYCPGFIFHSDLFLSPCTWALCKS